jgi:putative two-component system response regulator
MKVLIADDDAAIVQLLEIGLAAGGWQVCTASDAVRAFSQAKKEAPDAILLDIAMPGGHGLDVLRLMKDSPVTRQIPVIVISGSADPEMPQKVKDAGAVAYLAKPFTILQVLEALNRHSGKGPGREP